MQSPRVTLCESCLREAALQQKLPLLDLAQRQLAFLFGQFSGKFLPASQGEIDELHVPRCVFRHGLLCDLIILQRLFVAFLAHELSRHHAGDGALAPGVRTDGLVFAHQHLNLRWLGLFKFRSDLIEMLVRAGIRIAHERHAKDYTHHVSHGVAIIFVVAQSLRIALPITDAGAGFCRKQNRARHARKTLHDGFGDQCLPAQRRVNVIVHQFPTDAAAGTVRVESAFHIADSGVEFLCCATDGIVCGGSRAPRHRVEIARFLKGSERFGKYIGRVE